MAQRAEFEPFTPRHTNIRTQANDPAEAVFPAASSGSAAQEENSPEVLSSLRADVLEQLHLDASRGNPADRDIEEHCETFHLRSGSSQESISGALGARRSRQRTHWVLRIRVRVCLDRLSRHRFSSAPKKERKRNDKKSGWKKTDGDGKKRLWMLIVMCTSAARGGRARKSPPRGPTRCAPAGGQGEPGEGAPGQARRDDTRSRDARDAAHSAERARRRPAAARCAGSPPCPAAAGRPQRARCCSDSKGVKRGSQRVGEPVPSLRWCVRGLCPIPLQHPLYPPAHDSHGAPRSPGFSVGR